MNDFRKQFGSAQEGQVPETGSATEISAAGLDVPVGIINDIAQAIGDGVRRDHVDPIEISVTAKNAAADSVSLEFKTVGAGGGIEDKGQVDVPYDYDAKMPDGTTRREWQTAKL
jgi:hypothetical protein